VPSQVTAARYVQKIQRIWHLDRAMCAEEQQRNDCSILSENQLMPMHTVMPMQVLKLPCQPD